MKFHEIYRENIIDSRERWSYKWVNRFWGVKFGIIGVEREHLQLDLWKKQKIFPGADPSVQLR